MFFHFFSHFKSPAKVAVPSAWYISVPTIVFVLGIIIAAVLFFTAKSNGSRNQVVANKPKESQPPQPLQPAQLAKPARIPDYNQQAQQQQPPIEMKPRLTSAERSYLSTSNPRTSGTRSPPAYASRQPRQTNENEVQF